MQKHKSLTESRKNKVHVRIREKGRDLTLSYDKSPYTHRKIQKAT